MLLPDSSTIYTFFDSYEYLDLQLALFLLICSFCLNFCSFWHFTLTWTKRAHVCPDGRVCIRMYPVFTFNFPGRYDQNFGFKPHKMGKCQGWCPCAHLEKNNSKSINLSNELSLVLFQGCRHAQYVLFVFAVFAIMYHVFVYMCPIFSYVLITVGIYTCWHFSSPFPQADGTLLAQISNTFDVTNIQPLRCGDILFALYLEV